MTKSNYPSLSIFRYVLITACIMGTSLNSGKSFANEHPGKLQKRTLSIFEEVIQEYEKDTGIPVEFNANEGWFKMKTESGKELTVNVLTRKNEDNASKFIPSENKPAFAQIEIAPKEIGGFLQAISYSKILPKGLRNLIRSTAYLEVAHEFYHAVRYLQVAEAFERLQEESQNAGRKSPFQKALEFYKKNGKGTLQYLKEEIETETDAILLLRRMGRDSIYTYRRAHKYLVGIRFQIDHIRLSMASLNRMHSSDQEDGSRNRTQFNKNLFQRIINSRPYFGGVVFGNRQAEQEFIPKRIRIDRVDGKPVLVLIVQTPEGERECVYDDFTPSQLYVAYQVVKSRAEFKGLECNLLHCESKPVIDQAEFTMHPALVGTDVAQSLIKLDSLIPLRAGGLFNDIDLDDKSLQWYDATPKISIKNGKLSISSADGSGDCILRVRFWGEINTPDWLKSASDRDAEISKKIYYRTIRRLTSKKTPITQSVYSKVYDQVSEELLLDELGGNLKIDSVPEITRNYKNYRCIRDADQFAKLLSVLNWIADYSGNELPALPKSVRATEAKVKLTYRLSELWQQIHEKSNAEKHPSRVVDGESLIRDDRYAIQVQGHDIGYYQVTEKWIGEEPNRLREMHGKYRVEIKRAGDQVIHDSDDIVVSTPEGRILRFDFYRNEEINERSSGKPRARSRYRVKGVVTGNQVELIKTEDGKTTIDQVYWNDKNLDLLSISRSLAKTPLNKSEKRVIHCVDLAFDVLGANSFVAKGVEKTRLLSGLRDLMRIDVERELVDGQSTKETLWVNKNGQILKRKTEYETFLLTSQENVDRPVSDAIMRHAVKPNGSVIKPERLYKLRLRIRSVDSKGDFRFPETDRQKILTKNENFIELELSTRSTPDRNTEPSQQPELRRYLVPTDVIQSDVSRIKDLALQITGFHTDPLHAAREIEWFLSGNLRPTFVDADYSALSALDRMSGDCKSSATLLAALCRARGIPARLVGGWVYDSAIDRFIPHMWSEIYARGRWYELDATRGKGKVNATYLILGVSDGSDSQNKVLNESLPPIEIDVFDWDLMITDELGDIAKKENTTDTTSLIQGDRNQSIRNLSNVQQSFMLGVQTAILAMDYDGEFFLEDEERKVLRKDVDTLLDSLNVRQPKMWPKTNLIDMSRVNAFIYIANLAEPTVSKDLRDSFGEDVASAYLLGSKLIRFGGLCSLFEPEVSHESFNEIVKHAKTCGLSEPILNSAERNDTVFDVVTACTNSALDTLKISETGRLKEAIRKVMMPPPPKKGFLSMNVTRFSEGQDSESEGSFVQSLTVPTVLLAVVVGTVICFFWIGKRVIQTLRYSRNSDVMP